MNPIEKVHQQILAGNVLGPSGTWVSRMEALKRKRFLLKHIFSGEVEINGRWVNLSEIETKQKNIPMHVPHQPKSIPDNQPTLQFKKHPSLHSQHEHTLPPDLLDKDLSIIRQTSAQDNKSNFPPGLDIPQASFQADMENNNIKNSNSREKQTITIRSMPLGKETTLTISESRAGDALVAVCSIQGYIDQTNADDFQIQLMSMLDFGVRYFIIDCERTNLIGSAGWGTLAVTARLIKAADGHLLLCSMSNELEESYYLMQFNEVIDSQKSIDDSLESINRILTVRKSAPPAVNNDNQTFLLYGESFDDIPIQEKIKSVIARYGPLNFFQIRNRLKQPQYGKVHLSLLKLYLLLKELNLDSDVKRKRFYRSC